ncbi:MAG: hypothetical protein L3J29_04670 [Cyclobacteriaceae bacterium]|nr:hypothetical protein [Cyclobacteriaceae bacterium]
MVRFLILLIFITGCTLKADTEHINQATKVNGLSYAAANVLIDSVDIVDMLDVGANWVALMPYGFIREGEKELIYNSERQWVSETIEGIAKDIQLAQKSKLKIMLKPHVWIRHGAYTGDFELTEESDWKQFESSYQNYIVAFAKVAEQHNVELFCIGTEWRKFIKSRPAFWHQLIKEVRSVYNGKLTYAANWDEYPETPFWKEIDFIGVNGYFPLTETPKPTLEELELAWLPIINHLEEVSASNKKPILFTEFGYRSIEGTTIRPWESYTKVEPSMSEQSVALAALYNSTWEQPWFAGGFLWKWFNNHMITGGVDHTGYTPQNKPAQVIVKNQYEQSK